MKRSARTRLVTGLESFWENQLKILDQIRKRFRKGEL
ncbi:MAG: hypothetical protein QOG23_2281 [Blastocatellia bacterium]|nr:hypothetical protein [Blastocatellia bacterium]